MWYIDIVTNGRVEHRVFNSSVNYHRVLDRLAAALIDVRSCGYDRGC